LPRKHIRLYGGEPFLDEHIDIVSYILRKGSDQGFTFSAVTNGTTVHTYLPILGGPDRFTFFQITLDGPPEIHNLRRRYADGTGSFDHVADNISLLLARGYRVSLRVNVDWSNIEYAGDMMGIADQRGWNEYDHFTLYFAPIHEEGHQCIEDPSFSLELTKVLGDRYSYIAETRGSVFRIFEKVLRFKAKPEFRTDVCAATGIQFIFDPYGDIYPCWDSVGIEKHRIGRYIPELSLNENYEKWSNRTVAVIDECLNCPYLFLCKGGCPYYAMRENGSLNTPFCQNFQSSFGHQVRMAYKIHLKETQP
jgi:uncharacterized protein